MNKFLEYISSQFQTPKGPVGAIVTVIQNIANNRLYKATASVVSVDKEDKLLDIGYGNGYLLKLIYKKQPVDMHGVDISDDAKTLATKKNKKASLAGQLHLSVGDCCNLPYKEDMFDLVTSINTVYFWSDTVIGLSEIRRVLKKGKSFYNVFFTKKHLKTLKFTEIGYKKFEIAELVDAGKQAGFEKVEVKEISKDNSYIVVYTK